MIIKSKCYYPGDNVIFDNVMNQYCTFINNEWNIEIFDIKNLLYSLEEAYNKKLIYQDNGGWFPTEIIIDIYYNIITLRDSYIE